MAQLKLENVSIKTKKCHFKNFNLELKMGQRIGLIGQEAHVRTLLVDLIAGKQWPEKGSVYFEDYQISHFKEKALSQIGFVTDQVFFYENLTGYENLKLICKAYKKSKTILKDHILQYFTLFNLSGLENVLVKKYSLGDRQKLKFIRALMIQPKVLVLEEAFRSLDSVTIEILVDYLKRKCQEKTLCLIYISSTFNSLYLMAQKIGYISKGNLGELVDIEALHLSQRQALIISSKDISKLIFFIETELGLFDYEVIDDEKISISDAFNLQKSLIKIIYREKIDILEMKYEYEPFEDYFLKAGEIENDDGV